MKRFHFFKGISVISFGPLSIPTDARNELLEIQHNKTTKAFVNAVWASRREKMGPVKPVRSTSWPKTCLIECPKGEHGYLLRKPDHNVTAIREAA